MGTKNGSVYMAVLGTLGDVLPFVSLGDAIARRGLAVTVLSNSPHAALVQSRGLKFRPVAGPTPPQSQYRRSKAFSRVFIPAFESIFEILAEDVCKGGPLMVVSHDLCLGALFACERFEIPCVKVVLSPAGLPSFEGSPMHHEGALKAGRHGSTSRGQVAELLCINEMRRRLHLDEIRYAGDGGPRQIPLVLCMFPDTFRSSAHLLPSNARLVGFPFPKFRIGPMDEALGEFIAREGPPLVFTPGTGTHEVDEFFQVAADTTKGLRLPAVFLSPHARGSRYAASERIAVCEFVDLGELLPRAALVVHHGGIGTIAQAVRAGLPQIISPLFFDQPENAARVKSLCLGEQIARSVFTSSSLEESISRLLSDEILAERLERMSKEVAGIDAIGASINAMECALAGF